MRYASDKLADAEVDLFLAQALTSARPDSTFSKIALININNVEFFISTSDSQINGILSQYKTPQYDTG